MGLTSFHYMLWGFVLGVSDTHKKTQTEKGSRGLPKEPSNLGRRWPAALLDSKATDGIVIARDFWQQGAPRARRWSGPNPKKWSSWVGFLCFHFPRL